MAEALVLLEGSDLFMTAETRDQVVASANARPVPDGETVVWQLDGLRLVVLSEDDLREKARESKPYVPPRVPMLPFPRVDEREMSPARYEPLLPINDVITAVETSLRFEVRDRNNLPTGPSAKPLRPAPVRTGVHEAQRRRRQMARRAARAVEAVDG